MNSAYWFVAGMFAGWLITCLAIGISVKDTTHIDRLLRRLRLPQIGQPQDQDRTQKSQSVEQDQQQGKSKGNF